MRTRTSNDDESSQYVGSRSLQEECEQSAFIVFAKYCNDIIPDAKEVAALVGRPWSLSPSIFHLSAATGAQLGSALGLDVNAWKLSLGQDLVGANTGRATFVSDLRYCQLCLIQGWHSVLFQHRVVVKCPVHGTTLRFGCFHCNRPIATSVFAIARNHFHCPSCGKNLARERTRLSAAGPMDRARRGSLDAVRSALTPPSSDQVIRSPLRLVSLPEIRVPSAVEANVLAFHHAWHNKPVVGLRTFKDERYKYVAKELPQARVNWLARSVTMKSLYNISAALKRHGDFEDAPAALRSEEGSGRRIDKNVSVVSAAYWRTAIAFGVLRQVCGERTRSNAPSFGEWLPRTSEGIYLVVQSQVYGLLALNIIDLRGLCFGVQIAWNMVADPARFCPAWSERCPDGKCVEFRIRRRVTQGSVHRLVRRYAKRRLQAVPEHLNVLQVISG